MSRTILGNAGKLFKKGLVVQWSSVCKVLGSLPNTGNIKKKKDSSRGHICQIGRGGICYGKGEKGMHPE